MNLQEITARFIVYHASINYYELCCAIIDAANMQKAEFFREAEDSIEGIEKDIASLSGNENLIVRLQELCGLEKPNNLFGSALEYLKVKVPDGAIEEVEYVRKGIEAKLKEKGF